MRVKSADCICNQHSTPHIYKPNSMFSGTLFNRTKYTHPHYITIRISLKMTITFVASTNSLKRFLLFFENFLWKKLLSKLLHKLKVFSDIVLCCTALFYIFAAFLTDFSTFQRCNTPSLLFQILLLRFWAQNNICSSVLLTQTLRVC